MSTRIKMFLSTLLASPVIALVGLVIIGAAVLLPVAVLIAPDLIDEEVIP